MLKGYQFRYDVFCLEKQFYDKDYYENFCEIDRYDTASLHFAAIDNAEQVVGYIRMICESENGLPIQKQMLYSDLPDITGHNTKIAELSRLAIRHECRKHVTGFYSYHIQLGLYRMVYLSCKNLGITHLCAIMEKSLYNSLKKMKFRFNTIGPEFDDHGKVAPYMGEITRLESTLLENEFENSFYPEPDQHPFRTKFVFWGCLTA